jgi:hypothetical protein
LLTLHCFENYHTPFFVYRLLLSNLEGLLGGLFDLRDEGGFYMIVLLQIGGESYKVLNSWKKNKGTKMDFCFVPPCSCW